MIYTVDCGLLVACPVLIRIQVCVCVCVTHQSPQGRDSFNAMAACTVMKAGRCTDVMILKSICDGLKP